MTKQERLVLVVSILAAGVAFLDGAIVNVALPAIQDNLGGGLATQQWVVDAYLLTLGSFILLAGSVSDIFGRIKVLKLGLLGFGAASLLCAFAPSAEVLILARALQGIAGAFLVPSSLALIIAAFTGSAQSKAIGTWTAWTGIAFIIGPLLGGILIDQANWRWIFAINVFPITLTLMLIKNITMLRDNKTKTRLDLLGASLCVAALGSTVFALIEQPKYGWSDPRIYITFVIGLALLCSFIIYEGKAAHPMLKLSLFKSRNFSAGNLATFFIYAGLGSTTFLVVLFLQQVLNYSALAAGLSLLPITIIMFIFSPLFGKLSGKFGPRLFMGLGPLVAALGVFLLGMIDSLNRDLLNILPGVLIFGFGLSITVAPLTSAVLSGAPKENAGIASAINNAIARIAGLIAVALIGAIVANAFMSNIEKQTTELTSGLKSDLKQSTIQSDPPKPYQKDLALKDILRKSSQTAYQVGANASAMLIATGGVLSLVFIQNKQNKQTPSKS